MKLISKARAAAESAGRTFLQAAVPAFVLAVTQSRSDDVTLRDVLVAAAAAAAAAGIAAVFRVAKPIQTDRPSVAVEGLAPATATATDRPSTTLADEPLSSRTSPPRRRDRPGL